MLYEVITPSSLIVCPNFSFCSIGIITGPRINASAKAAITGKNIVCISLSSPVHIFSYYFSVIKMMLDTHYILICFVAFSRDNNNVFSLSHIKRLMYRSLSVCNSYII